jgi:hypothetical protein
MNWLLRRNCSDLQATESEYPDRMNRSRILEIEVGHRLWCPRLIDSWMTEAASTTAEIVTLRISNQKTRQEKKIR